MKARASGPCSCSDLVECVFDDVEGFVPCDLAEGVAVAEEGFDEAVVGVDVAPGELALDAGGDAVGGAMRGFDLEDVPVLGPDVEGAADGAVGADGLGAFDALAAHLGLRPRRGRGWGRSRWGFDAFDDVDHVVEDCWAGGW